MFGIRKKKAEPIVPPEPTPVIEAKAEAKESIKEKRPEKAWTALEFGAESLRLEYEFDEKADVEEINANLLFAIYTELRLARFERERQAK